MKDITREKYFAHMSEVASRVHEQVAKYVQPYTDIPGMLKLPNGRKGKGVMRALLTALVSESLGKPANDLILGLQEINNLYEYLMNAILDNKNGINEHQAAVNQNIICASIYREVMERMVLDLPATASQKTKILSLASAAMAECSIGQSRDIELTIDRIDQFESLEAYTDHYLEKSRLQSGCLYGFSAQVGVILAGGTKKQIELARSIGETIGIGMHISNDFGDFAIIREGTGFKCYQDQFADLKNGRLSLPIYYVLKLGTQKQKALFTRIASGKKCSESDFQAASRAIVKSGALQYGQRLFCRYEREAKKLIHQLPESENRNMLSVMSAISRSNKYLYALRHQ